jgi:hypothetical protein
MQTVGTMRFSERHGFAPVRTAIQTTTMDVVLRTSLWNVVRVIFLTSDKYSLESDPKLVKIAKSSQIHFFKEPLDDLPHSADDYIEAVRKWFFEAKWYEAYDYIEFLRTVVRGSNPNQYSDEYKTSEYFGRTINKILETEKSGYRFVGDKIAPIVNEEELDAIEAALEVSDRFAGARVHIKTALQLYSDRKNPDYRNSIKEAISAIESAACVIAADSKATLGQALKIIEKHHKIHPAMITAFDKLYGYTSNSGGIRHAMLEDESAGEQEALFMLVTCSAFLNFLVALVPK